MIPLLLQSFSPSSRAADVIPLGKGQPAPFFGFLFPPENAEALAKRVEVCEQSRKAEAQLAGDKLLLEKQACEAKEKITVTAAEEREKILQATVETAQAERDAALGDCHREWWDNPVLLVGAGVVLGAGVTIGIVALVQPPAK